MTKTIIKSSHDAYAAAYIATKSGAGVSFDLALEHLNFRAEILLGIEDGSSQLDDRVSLRSPEELAEELRDGAGSGRPR